MRIIAEKKTGAEISPKFIKRPIYYIAVSILAVDYVGFQLYNLIPVRDTDIIVPFILGVAVFLPPIVIFLLAFKPRSSLITRKQIRSSYCGILAIITLWSMVFIALTVFSEYPNQQNHNVNNILTYLIGASLVLSLSWYYSLLNKICCRGRLKVSSLLATHFVGGVFGTMAFFLEAVYSSIIEGILKNRLHIQDNIGILVAFIIMIILPTLLTLKLIWKVIEKEPPLDGI